MILLSLRRTQSGEISEPETPTTPKIQLSTYWNEMPTTFVLPQGQNSARWTFVLSADQQASVAQENFDRAFDSIAVDDSEGLHLDHSLTFQSSVWAKGDIEIQGDLHLQKVVRGCLYYLYTSLPSQAGHSANNQFYGLSPGGLPNGANNTDYQGHVFWDMETWMYPGILMLRPELARDMLSYRIHGIEAAFDRAAVGGYQGARFPWESAYTGNEVTPVICPACAENQQHITGDIAYAARQYISATRDTTWLSTAQAGTTYTGLDFILEMARFWNSRAVFNSTTQRYDINGKYQ